MLGKLFESSSIALAAAGLIATVAIVGTDEYTIIASPIALVLLTVALVCYDSACVGNEEAEEKKSKRDQ